MHCSAFFTLVIKINLGLAELALKMYAFSACVNNMSQLSLTYTDRKQGGNIHQGLQGNYNDYSSIDHILFLTTGASIYTKGCI
jgi:hypothetical protein